MFLPSFLVVTQFSSTTVLTSPPAVLPRTRNRALGKSNFSGNITNGVATFSGSENVSSVTAVAGTLDTLTVGTQYSTVLFQVKGGTEYLFVQGGTAGTSDDSVVSFCGTSMQVVHGFGIAATNTATVTSRVHPDKFKTKLSPSRGLFFVLKLTCTVGSKQKLSPLTRAFLSLICLVQGILFPSRF